MLIRIADLVQDSIVDGPGIRLTVFLQGCPHHCKGCHNPATWDYDGGKLIDTDDIIAMMYANPLLDGITLSGGEPFAQMVPCRELADAAHERGLSVWCYTGYTWDALRGAYGYESFELLDRLDVLVDGPYIEEQRTLELPWRGSRNQRLIDVQASLKTGHVVEYKEGDI
jgi:anaerobic ribonucleoside-triphosphate reductase activating protein